MQNLIIKIKDAIKKIEKERGNFKIKCLVANDLSNIHWDLVLSADWFEADEFERLDYLTKQILGNLDLDCMSQFSAIITFDSEASTPLIKVLTTIQENNKLGKYDDLGQGYTIVPWHYAAKWIIPLNEPEASTIQTSKYALVHP